MRGALSITWMDETTTEDIAKYKAKANRTILTNKQHAEKAMLKTEWTRYEKDQEDIDNLNKLFKIKDNKIKEKLIHRKTFGDNT